VLGLLGIDCNVVEGMCQSVMACCRPAEAECRVQCVFMGSARAHTHTQRCFGTVVNLLITFRRTQLKIGILMPKHVEMVSVLLYVSDIVHLVVVSVLLYVSDIVHLVLVSLVICK